MPDNQTLNGSSITGRKRYNELDLKEDVNMWDERNEKHCPKCGGKMMDLALTLTSYPAQRTSKCMSCGYTEDRDKNKEINANIVGHEHKKYVIDKIVGISCITTDGEKIFISFEK